MAARLDAHGGGSLASTLDVPAVQLEAALDETLLVLVVLALAAAVLAALAGRRCTQTVLAEALPKLEDAILADRAGVSQRAKTTEGVTGVRATSDRPPADDAGFGTS